MTRNSETAKIYEQIALPPEVRNEILKIALSLEQGYSFYKQS